MVASRREQLATRLTRVRDRVTALGLESLLVTSLPNVFYLTGLRASAAAAIVTPDEIELITDFRYLTPAATLVASNRGPAALTVTPVQGSYDETIRDSLNRGHASRVGVEADHLTLRQWTWLTDSLGDEVTLVRTEGLVEAVRLVKDAAEIDVPPDRGWPAGPRGGARARVRTRRADRT